MSTTLQPVLACGEGTTSDLSVFLSEAGQTYDVYIGVALLERIGADPEQTQRKMLVGRLCNAGVGVGKLREAFGHDPRTIKKWGAAIRSGDIDEMARAFTGRGGPGKVSPELIRYAQQLYRERDRLGRNYRQIIIAKIEEVFCVSISAPLASAMFRGASKDVKARSGAKKKAIDIPNEGIFRVNRPGSVKRSPTPFPAQTANFGACGEQFIHHAGQAIFANEMIGISNSLHRQLVAQILQGALNIEQSKTLCKESLSHFTGPVVTGLREQREGIDSQASKAAVLQVYKRNAALLADGPNCGDLFYYDPHTKEYTGQLKVLKGWCGRRHGITKVLNLDSFHTRSGRPCFVQHYSAYDDMRERFFTSLSQFNELFEQDKRRKRTFVIDRAIYSLAVLQKFDKDHIITWEKNYSGDGWDDNEKVVSFTRFRTKNHSDDRRYVDFKCQQFEWKRDPTFRRIIVRVSRTHRKDIEVSIITSHPKMDIQDVVWAIFRRWVQENDFKYLDTHFGLNQLTSRDSFSVLEQAGKLEDRPVDSPEYRELKQSVQQLENKLGRKLLQRRKSEKKNRELNVQLGKMEVVKEKLSKRLDAAVERLKNNEPMPRTSRNILTESADFRARRRKVNKRIEANINRQKKLNAEIAGLETEIEPLETRLCDAVRKQSRLQLLTEGDYRMLDPRKKSMMDAFRVTASNIFRNVQEQFRAIANDFRDDHVIVRMLSRCSGTMTRTSQAIRFKIWLPGTLQPHRIRNFKTLLEKIEQQANTQIPDYTPIRLELITGPFSI